MEIISFYCPDTKNVTHYEPAPAHRSIITSLRSEIIIKISLELFHKVPAGAIETLLDEQKQSLFKRADLGKYLAIRNIRDNFKEFLSDHAHTRSEIEDIGVTYTLGRAKNPDHIFINLDSAIEIAFHYKKNPGQLL